MARKEAAGLIEIRSDGDCILGAYEHILTHVDCH